MGLCVGITGVSSDLGRGLVPLLLADPRVERVVAFDVAPPAVVDPRLSFQRTDLTLPDSEPALTRALHQARLDALFHLAFVNSRVHGAAFAHELEVMGSMHVLGAAASVGLRRLILPSLTVLYGARAGAPTWHRESHPLLGCPGSRFISDRVEVEEQTAIFAERNPETQVVVLRFAPIVGPSSNNSFTRLLKTRVVPTVAGFDPLWQVVHEADVARALALALHVEARGAFNIAAPGVLPLSALVRATGGRTLPLPVSWLTTTISLLETAGRSTVPVPLLDLLRYSVLAETERARRVLGFEATYRMTEALTPAPTRGSAAHGS
jgi:UDP-glucose 4-epimerase